MGVPNLPEKLAGNGNFTSKTDRFIFFRSIPLADKRAMAHDLSIIDQARRSHFPFFTIISIFTSKKN